MSISNEKRPPGGKGSGNQKHAADDLEDALRKAIGATVQISTTTPGVSYEGVLYTACPITHMVAINQIPSSTSTQAQQQQQQTQPPTLSGSFHVIPVTAIEKFKLVSLPSEPDSSTIKSFMIPQERFQSLKSREEAAVRKQKTKDATRGRGVTKEAQELFDAIHRTLPTRWHGSTIVVNDAVMINPPYTPEDCQVERGKEASLVQVKKIMEHHLSRKKGSAPSLTPSGNPAAVVPALPLKGG